MSLAGRELILGVTGSIAAYKAVYLLRELARLGASVTVCLSEHAREFVGPLTFRTLSGRAVLSNLFDPQSTDAVEHPTGRAVIAIADRETPVEHRRPCSDDRAGDDQVGQEGAGGIG